MCSLYVVFQAKQARREVFDESEEEEEEEEEEGEESF